MYTNVVNKILFCNAYNEKGYHWLTYQIMPAMHTSMSVIVIYMHFKYTDLVPNACNTTLPTVCAVADSIAGVSVVAAKIIFFKCSSIVWHITWTVLRVLGPFANFKNLSVFHNTSFLGNDSMLQVPRAFFTFSQNLEPSTMPSVDSRCFSACSSDSAAKNSGAAILLELWFANAFSSRLILIPSHSAACVYYVTSSLSVRYLPLEIPSASIKDSVGLAFARVSSQALLNRGQSVNILHIRMSCQSH